MPVDATCVRTCLTPKPGHYGLRYYSPGLGRWINRDPIGEMSRPELFLAVGSLRAHGLYAFVQNDPLNTVDLLGLVPRIRWE